jgi:hypothetical protein
MKRGFKILFTIIVIVLVITLYVTFFYQPTCKDVTCWQAKYSECKRARYISSPIDVTWEYKINGKIEDRCAVEVKALEIKRGLKKTEILVGKEMTCFTTLGSISAPEGNPNVCTGPLKESMQELIIQKLHEYVVQNIGDIGTEITGIEGITDVEESVEEENTEETNSTS